MKRISVLFLVLILLFCMHSATAASFDPHRATAYMDIQFECGCRRSGTGAMVGRYGLITCAHNLCCFEHCKWYKSITFVFGAKSASSGRKKVSSGFDAWAYDTFADGYKSENDIGYVIFHKPVGDSTGWFATQVASDRELDFTFVRVYHYNKGRYATIDQLMNVMSDQQCVIDSYPAGGDGAPVAVVTSGDDYYTVTGVYTNHSSAGEGFVRRLTNKVFNDMKSDGAFR